MSTEMNEAISIPVVLVARMPMPALHLRGHSSNRQGDGLLAVQEEVA